MKLRKRAASAFAILARAFATLARFTAAPASYRVSPAEYCVVPAKSCVVPAKYYVILREGGGPRRGIQTLLLAIFLIPHAAADIDPQTGLLVATGYDQVKAQCTACHSGRLVAQNRADREGWLQMIRWMQDTQGLWPLGEAEPVILDYLAEHYGPQPRGRRAPLNVTFD